jgi:hypothetical protein
MCWQLTKPASFTFTVFEPPLRNQLQAFLSGE